MFVTARLADSLPAAAMNDWRTKQRAWLRGSGIDPENPRWRQAFADLAGERRRSFHEEFSWGFQKMLDRGHGACLLRDPRVAQAVKAAIRHFEGQRCAVGNVVLAGNHVHALVTPLGGWNVTALVSGWKRFSAREIHRLRGTGGRVWQPEAYDHLVRSQGRLRAIERYLETHK